jgi:hypothetical protein
MRAATSTSIASLASVALALGAMAACHRGEAASASRDSAGGAVASARIDSAPSAGSTAASGAAAPTCAEIASGQITSSGVGPLRLGARIAASRPSCALRDTAIVLSEGMRERAHVVPGSPVIALSTGTRDTSAIRILVRGAGPRTAKGIGVGSSVRELRAAYDSVCAIQGEGRHVVVTPALRGVSFAIDRPRPKSVTPGAILPSSNLAPWDSARVEEIWVHGGIVVGCHPA